MPRGAGFWVLLLAALGLVALVAGAPRDESGRALDPRSTGPRGTRAVVLLAEELGAEVDIVRSVPGDDVDVAVVLADRLGEPERRELEGWINRGGTAVIADPFSPFTPVVTDSVAELGLFAGPVDRGTCDVAALAAADRIDPGSGYFYETEGGSGSCFGDEREAFVVVTPVGAGAVAAVGGVYPFTNEGLGELDNAVLVGTLLAPQPSPRVAVFDAVSFAGADSEQGLVELVPRRVREALIQLGLAFVVYALVRARRLGRVVAEPQPTTIAASELVDAVGDLMAQRKDPAPAGAILRTDAQRDVRSALGLAATVEPEAVAAVVVDRGATDAERVRWAMAGPPVTDDAELVELAQDIHDLDEELLHGPTR